MLKIRILAVLDLAMFGIVNGPHLPARIHVIPAAEGAIAQLGERVVRNDEVGGSIPPGSTSLRWLRQLRLGKPVQILKSEACGGCHGVARGAKPGYKGSIDYRAGCDLAAHSKFPDGEARKGCRKAEWRRRAANP